LFFLSHKIYNNITPFSNVKISRTFNIGSSTKIIATQKLKKKLLIAPGLPEDRTQLCEEISNSSEAEFPDSNEHELKTKKRG
jgi:hypothetical protein